LMDVQMPVMDGYQTTKHLRMIPGCQTLPVIAMTANAMSNDRNKCLQADMDDFISKPILPETLYTTLASGYYRAIAVRVSSHLATASRKISRFPIFTV